MMKEIKYDTPFFNLVKIQHGKDDIFYEISVWLRFNQPQKNLFRFWNREDYQKVLSKIKRICTSKKYCDRGLCGVDSQALCHDLGDYLNSLKRDRDGMIELV